jgi:multidrug resistance efflux pump
MKRLRKHDRIDALGKQQRAGSVRWGRMIYLSLVTAFAGSIVYYLAGDTVVLSADGIVLKDRHAVDASYPAKVMEVFVKEGDTVEVGTPLLRLESFEMVKELADMAYRDGELAIREGQLRGKLGVIKTIMPLAERTARESKSTVARFDTVSTKGLIPALTVGDALRGSLQASERVADLGSQQEATEIELDLVAKALVVSGGAMEQLNRIYDGGNVRASAAGEVGVKVPIPGQVVSFGDELMQINGGKSYILAYLPDQYLFGVEAGMAVTVSGGGRSVGGRVESVLGVADALPAEFQNMFRPRDRSRLVRVVLDGAQPFAVSQKVRVSGCAFGLCWVR